MKRVILILLTGLFLAAPMAAERKKVAVVLGGGGAKGFAHIGVLKVLEEAGMPIDYMVGTSMGAIIGGLYSIGYDAAEIDSMVRKQDWMTLLSDKVERSSKSFPEKENSERYFLSVPFGKEKEDRIIRGMIRGQSLENLFSKLTIGYHGDVDFDSFPIPYACVAVDMVDGKEYVFRKGNLPLAMRSSMSIPAVFTPVRIDSMVLVDGGLNNNYPADVAWDMGADVVIGVDLGTSDLKLLERINTPADIIGQVIALHGHEKYMHNKETTDLLLRPDMEPYNSASFSRSAVDTLISRGEQIARLHWEDIVALKEEIGLAADENRPTLDRQSSVNLKDAFRIRHITFEGIDPRDEKWLLKISKLKENSSLTLDALENAMSIVTGTNLYSHVSYKLTGENPYDLQLMVTPKPKGSFNLGLRFDTEEVAAGLLNATYDHRLQNRSRFAFTGRVGKTSYARLDYSLGRNLLRRVNASYMFRYQDLDIFSHGDKTFNTTYTNHFAELSYSDMNWLSFMIKVGLRYDYFNYNSFLYTGENQDYQVKPEDYFTYFVEAHLETLDRAYFPTKGVSLRAEYSMHTDNFAGYNGGSPFSAIAVRFMAVLPLNERLSLIPAFYGRSLIGSNLAYPFLNMIGGQYPEKYMRQQLPFAGVNHTEIVNNVLGITRLDLRLQLWRRHYVTLTGNYGVHNDELPGLFKGSNMWGGSVGYAYQSIAGPVSVNLSLSDWDKSPLFYFNAGFYF